MKKTKFLIVLVLALFIFIPLKIEAAEIQMGLEQSVVEPGKEFNVGIYLKGVTTEVNQLNLKVIYDTSKLNYVNTFSSHGTPKAQNTNGNITIDLTGEKFTEGQALSIHFKTKDTAINGTSIVNLTATINGNSETLKASTTITHGNEIVIDQTPSNNPDSKVKNPLKSLFVTGCSLNPVFSSTILN
ncbi:MAG: hypothetical protein ACI31M_03220 [Bacilli bacterium]